MKAVLSPPALSRPWKAIVCAPAATVNAAVAYRLALALAGTV